MSALMPAGAGLKDRVIEHGFGDGPPLVRVGHLPLVLSCGLRDTPKELAFSDY